MLWVFEGLQFLYIPESPITYLAFYMFRAQTSETNSESRTDFELYNYMLGGGHTNDGEQNTST